MQIKQISNISPEDRKKGWSEKNIYHSLTLPNSSAQQRYSVSALQSDEEEKWQGESGTTHGLRQRQHAG